MRIMIELNSSPASFLLDENINRSIKSVLKNQKYKLSTKKQASL